MAGRRGLLMGKEVHSANTYPVESEMRCRLQGRAVSDGADRYLVKLELAQLRRLSVHE